MSDRHRTTLTTATRIYFSDLSHGLVGELIRQGKMIPVVDDLDNQLSLSPYAVITVRDAAHPTEADMSHYGEHLSRVVNKHRAGPDADRRSAR